jgi:hypothetical protein
MKAIVAWIRREPALCLSILSVIIGAIAKPLGLSGDVTGVMLAVAASLLGLRQVVYSPATVVEKVTEAATQAATDTAAAITTATAGTVGQVTGVAQEIVAHTVDSVVGTVLGKGKAA